MSKKKPLRLLIVGISSRPETFLVRLIVGLAKCGMRITISSKKRVNLKCEKAEIDWVPLSFLKLKFLLGQRWDAIYFPWNSAAIENIDLLELGIPAIVSCRGSQINIAPHNPERESLIQGLKETFEKTAAVHCVCAHIKGAAMQYGLNPSKASVIYPAVDPNFFYPVDKDDNKKFKIITVGSLVWCKGYEYALMSVCKLIEKGIPIQFDIIGDGPERQRVLYTIQDLGLEKNVTLHGRLSSVEVRNKLQESDVFLLSSLSEGVSNAVLEAMACGLPIVTTDCGGMREAVQDGEEGLVVPVRDPEAMASALSKLASDKTLRTEMGKKARQRILDKFTLERQIKEFTSLLESTCSAN